MSATRQDLESWLSIAKQQGARWMLVGLDRFDHENYPIYMTSAADLWDKVDHIGDNGIGGMGDAIEECYDLELDIASQMAERRARHFPPRPDR